MPKNYAKQLLRESSEKLENSAPGLLSKYPLDRYRRLLLKRNKFAGYREPGSDVKTLCDEIYVQIGKELLSLYHVNLLLYLIVEFDQSQYSSFPESIQQQYKEEFKRIVSELETNPSEWYSWNEDLFCKDLAICCCRMFPAGCLKTEIHAGIPRSMLVKVKSAELPRLIVLLGRLGGFSSFFEIHLDIRYKSSFNPEGWANSLSLVGQTLKHFPEAKGITGASWFFDPSIFTVSPRLSYLRQQIEGTGGKFFFAGSNERVVKLATSASSTRKKLYEEGVYLPASYMMIWPREDIFEWSGQ